MNENDILSTLLYVSGLINEFKKSKEREHELILVHLMKIHEQIRALASDERYSGNEYYLDGMGFCCKKLYGIIQNYKKDSNFVFTNELEEIKKKLTALLFMCG